MPTCIRCASRLGPEDAIYLVGEIPVHAVTDDELDRIIGSSLSYVDDVFPTAMAIGFAGIYRRRRAPFTLRRARCHVARTWRAMPRIGVTARYSLAVASSAG